jgi:hypothetical protein
MKVQKPFGNQILARQFGGPGTIRRLSLSSRQVMQAKLHVGECLNLAEASVRGHPSAATGAAVRRHHASAGSRSSRLASGFQQCVAIDVDPAPAVVINRTGIGSLSVGDHASSMPRARRPDHPIDPAATGKSNRQ